MESPTSPSKDPGLQLDAEYDELDDFDSDDDDPTVFKIRDSLEQASGVTYTTKQLHDLIHEGVVDLNPPYQRDVVWPESKQIGLIDSIFRNFWVPPIVFTVKQDTDDGEETRICVDGKQRLTSIQKFFDGQIPHKDPVTKKSWWYTISDKHRANRQEVPAKFKHIFAEKKITCVEYHNLTSTAERDIFQRVQLGMSLTAAEKMQAISSPWAEWISVLEARHVAVEGGLSHVLEWDTKRGRDFQNIAFLVCCCDGLPETQHIPTAQKMEKWLVRVDRPTEKFKEEIEEVLREFWNIAANPTLDAGFKKIGRRLAPVEFIFIGVLLYVMRKRPIQQRAETILRMRKAIRSEFKDIRNNSTVAKSMWNFISTIDMNNTSALYNGYGESSRGKKKRKADTDDEEDEYRPQPIKSLGKTLSTRSKQQKTR